MANGKLSEKVTDIIENNGWRLCSCEKMDWEYYAEMEKYSPAGEDYVFTVWFNGFDADFIEKVCEYAEGYDADDHAADLVQYRGQGGVPNSVREIIDDAEEIGTMLSDLADELSGIIDEVEDMGEDYVRENWEEMLESPVGYEYIARKIGWGFTHEDLETLMQLHKAGKYREKIEDLLTDCNFHTECADWGEGNYIFREDQ